MIACSSCGPANVRVLGYRNLNSYQYTVVLEILVQVWPRASEIDLNTVWVSISSPLQ